jgi:hypothetical protein
MPTDKLNVRFVGIRVPYGSLTRTDRVVAVDNARSFAGMLQVFEVNQETQGAVQTISPWMAYQFGCTADSPALLARLEVLNPNSAAATFRLALLTTPTGSPDAANAFLAWDTPIDGHGVFSWSGAVPLIDRYIYTQASMTGLLLYRELLFITPH